MFDIGWGELFLIGVVALIVVGPKELPRLFRTVGNFMGKARGMAREFQRSLEQAADESGMSEVPQSLRSIDRSLNSATTSARKFASSMTRLPDTPKAAPERRPSPQAAAPPAPAAGAPAAGRAPDAEAAPKAGGRGQPPPDGRRRRHRRHDGAADRAPRGAAHPADQLAVAFCVAMVACFAVAGPIFNFLAAPLAELLVEHGQKPELIFTGLQQGFFTQVRISVFGGFVAGLPGDRLPALALRRARPLPAGEARLPAVPDRLAGAVHPRLRLRLLRAAAAGLRLLPRLPAVRRRTPCRRATGRRRSSTSAPSTSTCR